jgi:hypothetical protein
MYCRAAYTVCAITRSPTRSACRVRFSSPRWWAWPSSLSRCVEPGDERQGTRRRPDRRLKPLLRPGAGSGQPRGRRLPASMAPRPTARLGRYSEHLVPECRVSSEEAIRRFSPSRERTGMWKLAGVGDACACSFSDLATALDCARSRERCGSPRQSKCGLMAFTSASASRTGSGEWISADARTKSSGARSRR